MTPFKEYESYDGLGLAALIARKDVSLHELLDAAMQRIEALNPRLNAINNVLYDEARAVVDAGPPDGPFRAVPFILKDIAALFQGTVTSFGSRLFAGAVADYDSEIVVRYKSAGLIICGKTNTSEMGLVVTTEPRAFGPTRNPWNLERSAGGSSGGAAAVVAAGILPCAHATDGGGSIRIPASCCGLFGLKVTRARAPLGPEAGERNGGYFTHHAITRSVRDSAALLDVVSGPAPGDPYWAPPPARPFLNEVGAPPGKLRIALQTAADYGTPIDAVCADAARSAAHLCSDLGHAVEEAAPEYDWHALLKATRVIWSASVSAAIATRCRALGRAPSPDDVEPFTWQFFESGRQFTAPEYVQAVATVHAIGRRVRKLF